MENLYPDQEKERLDKFLQRKLPLAGFGFLQKMLRKKNIVLNGKRARGAERVSPGDVVSLFFSTDTFNSLLDDEGQRADYEYLSTVKEELSPVYSDEEIIIFNKAFGLLSQKSTRDDISINEMAISFLIRSGMSFEDFCDYRPSILNRLDRNTGGLIMVAKTRAGAVKYSEYIKEKKLRRMYQGIALGDFSCPGEVSLFYKKEKDNTAVIADSEFPGSVVVKTIFNKLDFNGKLTLFEAELITGKSHQIRAVAAHLGYPLLGDDKYGEDFSKSFPGEKSLLPAQYLFSYRMILPDGKVVTAKVPRAFSEVMDGHME